MKKKTVIGILLLLLLIAAAAALCFLPKEDAAIIPAEQEGAEPEAAPQVSQSEIDFTALQKKNADIYGWLTIPGTEIDYPVVQNEKDDSYYLTHSADRKEDSDGALFTEHAYNRADFSDRVTVIYGHHMKSGAMFGNLQQIYTDAFEEHRDITVYTPTEELHYQVFAAVPYSNRHILYYYDAFRMQEAVEEFMEEIMSTRSIGATTDPTVTVGEGDKLLVLSTCLQGDNTKRFLVIGKLVSD